jgi:hypothetical protein
MPDIELPHPDEVREKAERPFTRAVALFVAIYAVGLAVASFGGHNAAKEMLMAKQEEANQWARYQSKSTRAALYKIEYGRLAAERQIDGERFPQAKAKLLRDAAEEEARTVRDMKLIMDGGADEDGHELKGARHYQAEVKLIQRKDPYFDFAEVAFQIAIVLASVAMLSGRRWAFAASLVLAVGAVLLTVNGFGLFVAVPGLDGGS